MFKHPKSAAILTGSILTVLALTACGSEPKTSNAAATPSTPPDYTLSADGYGKLRLGMTVDQAKATGELGTKKSGDNCQGYDLAAFPTPADTVSVYFSKQHGLVGIFASETMSTKEGIKLGSTIQQVKTAYPKAAESENGITVDVPGSTTAFYTIGTTENTKTVTELGLATKNQDCFG
ncbi:hypothetical protein [Kribbella italica]|uniref:Uncharacterized protein n=1 Tax=Kribbella italica TaxID=1540520 RepID=A0A7W9J1A9_9ACTN|nr:hypothetical protein [Kribbella italica]MBB5833797.1 hypothetical protein [Kribbella italica]